MKIISYYKNWKLFISFIHRCREKENSFGKFKLLTVRNQIIIIDKSDNETLRIDL